MNDKSLSAKKVLEAVSVQQTTWKEFWRAKEPAVVTVVSAIAAFVLLVFPKAMALWQKYPELPESPEWVAIFASLALTIVVPYVITAVVSTHQKVFDELDSPPMDAPICAQRMTQEIDAERKRVEKKGQAVSVDVIAVALTHSRAWIEDVLFEMVRENKEMKLELRIVLVEPEYLESLRFIKEGELTWGELGTQTRQAIHNWPKSTADIQDRMKCLVVTVPHLSQLHGVLIRRKTLFLGRVSFPDANERLRKPPRRLTCALNGYRQYREGDSRRGSDRIELFRNWLGMLLDYPLGAKVLLNTFPSREGDTK